MITTQSQFKMRIYINYYSNAFPTSTSQSSSPAPAPDRPTNTILTHQNIPMHRLRKPVAMPTGDAEPTNPAEAFTE